MTKQELIAQSIRQLEVDLKNLQAAAQATYEAATGEESKAENQYDTFGLEASYLAGAQAKRVAEIEDVLGLFRTLPVRDFTKKDEVQMTALVDINLDGKKSSVLVMPKGGGVNLQSGSKVIQIVTPDSALGDVLLGARVGDELEFETAGRSRVCEVLGIS